MNIIKKYQFGGAIAAEPIIAALAKAAPVILPLTGMGAALYMDYKYPEKTAYYKGTQRAQEALNMLQARNFQIEAAQNQAEAEAYNKGLAKYYSQKLANGPIVTPYVNGGSKTITAYNPIEGTYVGKVEYPSGSYMEGTFPELNFRHINGADLAKLSNATITYPNKGTFTAKLNSIDGNTAQYVPGTLVQGLTPTVNLPASIAIDRLTNVAQPISVPLVMSKKFNFDFNGREEDEIIKSEETVATPTPEEPKNPEDNWWKKLGKSFTNSFKRSSKAMGTGFTNGADVTMKAVGYSLPPIITLGTIAGLTYGGYKAGERFGFWGDENQPEPVKPEQSEPELTYDNADLKEMIKRQNEIRSNTDSLNNVDKQKGGL